MQYGAGPDRNAQGARGRASAMDRAFCRLPRLHKSSPSSDISKATCIQAKLVA